LLLLEPQNAHEASGDLVLQAVKMLFLVHEVRNRNAHAYKYSHERQGIMFEVPTQISDTRGESTQEQSISDSTSQAPSRVAVSAMKSDTPGNMSEVRDDVANLTDISVETSHQVLKKESAPKKGQSHAMNGSHNARMQVRCIPPPHQLRARYFRYV
jgi:hypothetical protein